MQKENKGDLNVLRLYEICGQENHQYVVAYEDKLGELLHHPKIDLTMFRGKVTIKNLGEVLIGEGTLERLAK